MSVVVCPEWEYKNVTGARELLAQRAPALLIWLHNLKPSERMEHTRDTRQIHKQMFSDLTPEGFEYYAGHYRGENYTCLKHSQVGIASNPIVGLRPDYVDASMNAAANGITEAVEHLDIIWPVNERVMSKAEKLRRTAEVIAVIFNHILIIHPYVNGNGHMARFIAIAIFSRYGIMPRRFPINKRPPDPPYSSLIANYQRGDKEGFIDYLISCI